MTASFAEVPPEWEGGALVWAWAYRACDGHTILGWVARYTSERHRKKVVPFFRHRKKGWEKGAPPQPSPLFGLHTLPGADRVCIVEGERCAAALHGLGIPAVTSQGGSTAARLADWSPLSGIPQVYLLPDNDHSGEHYTREVQHKLAQLHTPPRVTVILLPDLGPGEDIVDWLMPRTTGWDGFAPLPDEPRPGLREELMGLLDGAEEAQA
jgi:hypothetical protein